MADHPLKMKDKLKAKKRPTSRCKIFVGDPDEHRKLTETSFMEFITLFKDFKPGEMTPELRDAALELTQSFSSVQEPYFQTFVFRAIHPVEFERFAEEHPPREGTSDIAYNYETFPMAVFKRCLVEPTADTLNDEEWEEFFANCSQKERRLLLDTALECNLRHIEPTTPKDLMTR